VAQDHVLHLGLRHPVDAGLGVDLRPEVGREEAVRLQPPRGHQDEHPERRVGEPEARRQRLGVHADLEVHLVDVVVVDAADLLGPLLVVRELVERAHPRHPHLLAEVVVARDAALAVAQDVERCQVHQLAVDPPVALERARVVVQRDLARVVDADRVDQVRDVEAVHERSRLGRRHLLEPALLDQPAGLVLVEVPVVRDQRVHPVDRDELLGQLEARAVVLLRRAHDPAEDLGVAEAAEAVLDVLAEQAGVVRVHRRPERRVVDDARRPLDRVDLGHQRRVDQPRRVEQPLVVPARVLLLENVADRVVLLGEQRVQAGEPEPPVLVEAGQVDAGLGRILRQPAVRPDLQLAVLEGADRVLGLLVGAVDLRAVPPVGLGVAEVDPVAVPGGPVPRRRDADRAMHVHRMLRPVVVVGDRHLHAVLGIAAAMEEPVVVLELDPRGGEDVEARGRLELVARHQLERDGARVRVVEPRRLLGLDPLRVDVARELGLDRAHLLVLEVVPHAVGTARGERLRRRLLGGLGLDLHRRVEQVHVAQVEPQRQQVQQAERERQLVPLLLLVDAAEDPAQHPASKRSAHVVT
jgi:hypothetical protein